MSELRCCSYFGANPLGGYLIGVVDAVVNVALLAISLVFIQVIEGGFYI